MKKLLLYMTFVATALFGGGCDSGYDDTRIKQDIDEVENRLQALERAVDDMNLQMKSLTALYNSSFVSFISTDADGNSVITYIDKGGDSHTITLALESDVVTLPIIGAAKDTDGVWYWRQTTDNGASYTWLYTDDNQKIKVGGQTPIVGIDKDGYWTVNGVAIVDTKGRKVLANDVSNTLFDRVYVDEKSGEAVFVLSDGEEIRVRMFESLSLSFDTPTYSAIDAYDKRLKIKYTVSGSQSAGAMVDIFTAYNVTAVVDASLQTITVALDSGAAEGNILVMAHAGGNTILKPLFFTFGSAVIAEPEYNGSTGDIMIEGELTPFQVKVSSNIDYAVSVSDDAAGWLIYNGTRAMVTTTHNFTADYYENASGALRVGTIRFSNRLYNISAAITVKQAPTIPVGTEGGISTASDLVAFSAAVNAGASTSRWQNTAGEVVLLNDIDMASVTSWTPIGGIDPSGYTTTEPYKTVNAFTGVFNGQGFAIKNLHYTANLSSAQYGYALFGSIEGATLKNLTLGSADATTTWSFTGTVAPYTACASLVAYALNSTIEACTNYVNLDFVGDNAVNECCTIGGLVGVIKNSTIGGKTKALGCINRGFVRTGRIANTANGGTGMQTAGICSFMAKDAGNMIQYCVNYGDVSSPTGRTGGVAATMMNGNIKNSDNRGTIEDDAVGQYAGKAPETTYNYKRMGGLVGGTDDLRSVPTATIESCTNYGNVMTHLSARTGGFVGHANIQMIGCVNKGAILGDLYTEGNGVNRHGPGWACGYSAASTATWINATGCSMGGYVGSYTTYKTNPTSAPAATSDNAFCHDNSRFNASINN